MNEAQKLDNDVISLLAEDTKRTDSINTTFNPITGQGAILDRERLCLSDFPIKEQYLPVQMFDVPLIKKLAKAGSIDNFGEETFKQEWNEEQKQLVIEQVVRIRIRYDFCFWAASFAYIKNKGGGLDVRFVLNRPQRKLILAYERKRIKGKPIRLILLKARQWGGSTATQLYMAWLQLVHKVGLNSLIVGLQNSVADEIQGMFDKMMKAYPVRLLYSLGEAYNDNTPIFVGFGKSGNIHRVPQRNCKIKIGSAERPDSVRGGDYNLVHCSEVGLWKKTDGKSPEDMVRSACAGILLKAYTMIVYESTANGTGNFFQREYDAAKLGRSQFEALFIPWFDIDLYSLPFDSEDEKADFAIELWKNRNNESVLNNREENGKYLWYLWEKGATLEAIHWYVEERKKYEDHALMAAEYPSDDEEAFVHSGARVFDKFKVNKLRKACRPPKFVGDVYTDVDSGEDALTNLRFNEDKQGLLWIWEKPIISNTQTITDRYLTIVDVGGRSNKADWSVIVVFDRMYMIDGDKPVVVAQWYGHIDIDLLAWKAAQIAAYYDNSLLVIESNTLETHDKERQVDGDQSHFILNQIKDVYPNLYARKQSEEEIEEGYPKKYGFHTNVATKPMIISTLVKVIREGLYVERDERCLDEYITYERRQNGSYGAIIGKHDDLLMTRAIGMHICYFEMDLPTIIAKERLVVSKRRTSVTEATI